MECEAPLFVQEARGLLVAVEHAYNGVLAYDSLLEAAVEQERRFNRSWPFTSSTFVWTPSEPAHAALLVDPAEALVLRRVELTSPGFWEFLGTLNPLEVTRKYLQDRHLRRQDRLYREVAEQRRLNLENEDLATEVMRNRMNLAREAGVPDAEITAMFNHYVAGPLHELDVVSAAIGVTGTDLAVVDPQQ